MMEAVADRLAEAFAELLHYKMRTELWGYAPDEKLSLRGPAQDQVLRHPPGARLPDAARPHREEPDVEAARRPEGDGHRAHRQPGHAPRRLRLGARLRQPVLHLLPGGLTLP